MIVLNEMYCIFVICLRQLMVVEGTIISCPLWFMLAVGCPDHTPFRTTSFCLTPRMLADSVFLWRVKGYCKTRCLRSSCTNRCRHAVRQLWAISMVSRRRFLENDKNRAYEPICIAVSLPGAYETSLTCHVLIAGEK